LPGDGGFGVLGKSLERRGDGGYRHRATEQRKVRAYFNTDVKPQLPPV